ncbi:MAG: ABC transporter substrate-binding protein [Eubacterium sp.]
MNKVIKKVTAVALSALMIGGCFAGCSSATTDTEASGDVVEAKTSYNIGICQLVQHPALDAATQGFKDKLTALGEENGITFNFDEQNASGEATNCTTINSKFVSDNVDLIMANATDAMATASQATADIPIVATSITDYATGLGIEDWTGKTGFNVTGTSDLAPLADQAAMIKELVPDAETVAILYCSAEKNSKYQSDVIQQEIAALGMTSKEYTFVDTNDVSVVTQQIVTDKCDVVFIPTDNTAASNTEAINNILEPAGVPVIAGEEGICTGCGLATLSISYYSIGEKAGEMAYDILVNGADPAEMEIQYASDLTKKYVADRAEKLGITIPEDYEAITEE